MKVGILSVQRIYNYCSFMQSYSLKNIIEAMGHQCVFLNIQPGRKLEQFSFTNRQNFLTLLKKIDVHLFNRIDNYIKKKKKAKIFSKALKNNLGVECIKCGVIKTS